VRYARQGNPGFPNRPIGLETVSDARLPEARRFFTKGLSKSEHPGHFIQEPKKSQAQLLRTGTVHHAYPIAEVIAPDGR
jgi:hypothetical protein